MRIQGRRAALTLPHGIVAADLLGIVRLPNKRLELTPPVVVEWGL